MAQQRRGVLSLLAALPLVTAFLGAGDHAARQAAARRRHVQGERRRKRRRRRKKKCAKLGQTPRRGKRCCRGLAPGGSKKCAPAASQPCAGACVPCTRHSQCGAGFLCLDNGTCRACTVQSGDSAGLQTALSAGGSIFICPGTYSGNFTVGQNDVILIGAGDGADPAANTILDANGSGRVLDIGGPIVTLLGLRLTGGNSGSGAGVRNDGGALAMGGCTVTGNVSSDSGGGICNVNRGVLTLSDCTVSDNDAVDGGGIHHSSDQQLLLSNTIVERNDATGDGGGIYVDAGALATIQNQSAVRTNTAVSGGGGIFNLGTVNCSAIGAVSGNTVGGMANNCIDAGMAPGTGCDGCN
jgi:hypothetical protein